MFKIKTEEKSKIEAWMAKFPEVQWDRFTHHDSDGGLVVIAYGWIARADNWSDFLVVWFGAGEPYRFITSSVVLSPKMSERLNFGDESEGHKDCIRVESVFNVTNCIRLAGIEADKAVRAPKNIEELTQAVGAALQLVWDEHCADTGNLPICFQKDGRNISAQFVGSSFVAEAMDSPLVKAAVRAAIPDSTQAMRGEVDQLKHDLQGTEKLCDDSLDILLEIEKALNGESSNAPNPYVVKIRALQTSEQGFKKQLEQSQLNELALVAKHDAVTDMVSRFCVAWKGSLPESWMEGFIECGAVTVDLTYPTGFIAPVKALINAKSLQARVQPWLLECFGAEVAGNKTERNHRFLEEALELVQSLGCTQSEAHQLVDYVFGRPVGEPNQEAGGVMITLAALCLANGLDMHAAGETELARIWGKTEKIRAKQATKPKRSPLPGVEESACCVRCGEKLTGVMALTATLCGLCGDDHKNGR